MTAATASACARVDLADLQGLVVFRRPAPYWGSVFLVEVQDPLRARRSVSRLLPLVVSAAEWAGGRRDVSVALALTGQGLRALGVADDSLASFPDQLRLGMAARAEQLHDTGDSSPEHWDAPFGTGRIHLIVSVTAASAELWREQRASALAEVAGSGVAILDEIELQAHPGMRTNFGYRDGLSFPNIAGLPGSPITTPEPAIATGEFLLGHPGEAGVAQPVPVPAALGHNGTYLGVRKVHTDVAAFRRFLADHAPDPEGQEQLAAKLLGRWRSGAPLILAPHADDPELASDPSRVNAFGYADDPRGLVCPVGAHTRRLNPRDSPLKTLTDVRIHRLVRFGAVYGPPLPDGSLIDDGADRGLYFMFLSARPDTLEFLKGTWIDDGGFIGLGGAHDPVAGRNDAGGTYTIPALPIRRRLHGLSSFTTTRGGEYAFLPSLTALRWLTQDPTEQPQEESCPS
jgi:Dyp-type peroxidase family